MAFNHACGCSKCWKPAGALFSVVGVKPRDAVQVTAHPEKLKIVDESAPIQCVMLAPVAARICLGALKIPTIRFMDWISFTPNYHRKPVGLKPEFAAFVSSIIETGTPPAQMGAIRQALADKGLPTYDRLSPVLMDLIATHAAKAKGTYREALISNR